MSHTPTPSPERSNTPDREPSAVPEGADLQAIVYDVCEREHGGCACKLQRTNLAQVGFGAQPRGRQCDERYSIALAVLLGIVKAGGDAAAVEMAATLARPAAGAVPAGLREFAASMADSIRRLQRHYPGHQYIALSEDVVNPDILGPAAKFLSALEVLAAPPQPAPTEATAGRGEVALDYTNHRGERGVRTVIPTGRLLPGDDTYHPGARWVIEAWDVAKGALRTFDPAKIHRWGDQEPRSSAAVFRQALADGKAALAEVGLGDAAPGAAPDLAGVEAALVRYRTAVEHFRDWGLKGSMRADVEVRYEADRRAADEAGCAVLAAIRALLAPTADMAGLEEDLTAIERQVKITCELDRKETAKKQADPLPTTVEISLSHVTDAVRRLRGKLAALRSGPAAGVDARGAIDRPRTQEDLAQFLHDEVHGHDWTWPEHDDDTGKREGGYVCLTPTDVRLECRDEARRIWIFLKLERARIAGGEQGEGA